MLPIGHIFSFDFYVFVSPVRFGVFVGCDRMVVGFTCTIYLCNQCLSPLKFVCSIPTHGESCSILGHDSYLWEFLLDLMS